MTGEFVKTTAATGRGTSLNRDFMSRTKAVHVDYNLWYISLPASVKTAT